MTYLNLLYCTLNTVYENSDVITLMFIIFVFSYLISHNYINSIIYTGCSKEV